VLFAVEELCNTGTILPEILYNLQNLQRSQTLDHVQISDTIRAVAKLAIEAVAKIAMRTL
jgi:hypothetical protein